MPRLLVLLLLVALVPACKSKGTEPRCFTSADCDEGEGCYLMPSGAQRCLEACDSTEHVLCEGGELCVSVPGEDAADDVCLPGGTVAVGAACATSAECTKGTLCFTVGADSTCRRACEVAGAATCMSNETCVSLDPDAGVARGACFVP